MQQEELDKVLKLHKLWACNENGGIQADLREADLREANLWKADLRKADLGEADLGGANLRKADLREADLWKADLGGTDGIIHVQFDYWDMWMQAENTKIGCEYKSHTDWLNMDYAEASESFGITEKQYNFVKAQIEIGMEYLK